MPTPRVFRLAAMISAIALVVAACQINPDPLGPGSPASGVILGSDDRIVIVPGGDGCPEDLVTGCAMPTARTAADWPFAWNSIWNVPIGDGARYLDAGIDPSPVFGVFADEDILILEPNAPRVDVVAHNADWDPNRSRCGSIAVPGRVLLSDVPVPRDFTTEPTDAGDTPNNSAAILMPDGRTIRQTQPLHRCGPGGAVVSQYLFPDDDIRTGTGIVGAHGGSAMSSLGGTIRVGELVPGGEIHHALKIVVDSRQHLWYDRADPTPGFRWPATAADSGASSTYGGTIPEFQMGALLALRPDFDVSRLRTDPAKILARALVNYGTYVVDSAGWDNSYFATEFGPNGRVTDEFEDEWGFPFVEQTTSTCRATSDPSCQWSKDIADITGALHIVTNNGPTSIGGPGSRRRPCAPPFTDGSGGAPASCVTSGR